MARVATRVTLEAIAPVADKLHTTTQAIAPMAIRLDTMETKISQQIDHTSQILAAITSLGARLSTPPQHPPYGAFPAVHTPMVPPSNGPPQDASYYGSPQTPIQTPPSARP